VHSDTPRPKSIDVFLRYGTTKAEIHALGKGRVPYETAFS
jgi:hypothetical protein